MIENFTPSSVIPADAAQPLGVAVSVEGQVLCGLPSYQLMWEGVFFEYLRDQALSVQYLGLFNNRPCFVLKVDYTAPDDMKWCSLRTMLPHLDRETFHVISRATQLLSWSNNHRYCGSCGEETVTLDNEHAVVCESCKLRFYPRISPCVIVLVRRGDECLLARNAAWTDKTWFSALAGFVEAGESVEQALHREIYEEVGIRVANIEYYESESWPFPGQLMLGFFADYQSGDIVIDEKEIAEARWWRYDELPLHPPRFTISGRLIHHFIDSQGRL